MKELSFKNKFQAAYCLIHCICLLGIAGNIELGIKTPAAAIVLTVVTGILTAVKVIHDVVID